DAVEAVHRAAVDRGEPRRERVPEIVRILVWRRGELDGRTGRVSVVALQRLAAGRPVGARILPEVVVEGVVLLDQEDQVLDRVLPGRDRAVRRRPRLRWRGRVSTWARTGRAFGPAARPELPDAHEDHDDDEDDPGTTTSHLRGGRPTKRRWPDDRRPVLHRA